MLIAVEFVAGVHGIANVADCGSGEGLNLDLFEFFHDRKLFLRACCSFEFFGESSDLGHDLFIIRTLVREFREFHQNSLL